MVEEKKDFLQVEDLLPEGNHLLRVKKHPEFEDKKPVQGSHKVGTSSFGNWYMYDTKLKNKEGEEEWVSLFANDENKIGFDTGFIRANIVPRRAQGGKDDIFDKDGNKLLKAFYNVLSEAELKIAKDNLIKSQETKTSYPVPAEELGVKAIEDNKEEDEIDIEDIPF